MDQDTESSDDSVEFAALIGLEINRLIFSRYQLDIEFVNDGLDQVARATFETEILLKTSNDTYTYNIQTSIGSIPIGILFGVRIRRVSYRESESFTLQFQGGLTLTCSKGAEPEGVAPEFGIIGVNRGNVQFLMPLL